MASPITAVRESAFGAKKRTCRGCRWTIHRALMTLSRCKLGRNPAWQQDIPRLGGKQLRAAGTMRPLTHPHVSRQRPADHQVRHVPSAAFARAVAATMSLMPGRDQAAFLL